LRREECVLVSFAVFRLVNFVYLGVSLHLHLVIGWKRIVRLLFNDDLVLRLDAARFLVGLALAPVESLVNLMVG